MSYADDVAAPLSADLSRYARNWFVNEADLCGNVIVLKRNSADAGEDLSVDASSLNNYIESATIVGKTLVLAYNSDRFAPLSIDIADFIKDYYIADAKLCADSKLHLKYNADLDDIVVDLHDLDDKIVDIKQENDTIQFRRTNGTLPVINLSKYVNNNLSTMHIHGNALVLKFDDGRTKDVSLDKFDKWLSSYTTDENNLYLMYNNNKGCLTIRKSDIAAALVNVYVDLDNIMHHQLNDGTDIKIPVSRLNYELTSGVVDDSNNICLKFTNRKDDVVIDASNLKSQDTYISSIILDDKDNLVFDYNRADVMAKAVCLHKFAKNDYIKSGSYNEDTHYLTLNYNNPDEKDPLSIYIPAIDDTYVSNGRFNADDKSLVLSYNKDRSDIRIKMDVLSAISFDAADDTSVLSIAETVQQIVEAFGGNADVKKQQLMSTTFASGSKSDVDHYVASGKFDVDSKKLIFNYNTEFAPLAIDMNVLSGMNFVAKPTTKMREIADAIKQIVEAFGGNR